MPASAAESPRRFRFGVYELDVRAGELRKNGLTIKLQKQPLQVLKILLGQPGEIITREELRNQLWPADTFVDFDHSLNSAVQRLRDVLGDSGNNPRYIETLPRYGYRFISQIEEINAEKTDSRSWFRKHKRLLIGAGSIAVVIVSISVIAFWRAYQKPDPALLSSIEVVPLISLHGVQAFPAISPDGNQVAFAQFERKHEIFSGEDGAIYTALIGGDKPLQLTAKSGVCCPTWSPDGRQIAFLRLAN